MLASVSGSITSQIADHGVYAVFLLMLVDAVLPAASELVMVYAGALAAGAFAGSVVVFGADSGKGLGAYVVMVLAGTLGYTVGSIAGWAIGLYGGRPFLERRGRLFHLPPEKLDRAERWFERWGDWAVLVGRITPLARSFVSIPAGVLEFPLGRYTVLTAAASLIWCLAFGVAGHALGSSWDSVHHAFRYADYVAVMAVVAAAVGVLLVARHRRMG